MHIIYYRYKNSKGVQFSTIFIAYPYCMAIRRILPLNVINVEGIIYYIFFVLNILL